MTAVMQGVRILEVAEQTFVPAASALLSDWGADVIKIEHAVRGDAMRGLASTGVALIPTDVHVLLEHSNRGKRSLGLDLSTDEGRAILYQLAATADVFLTNKLPGVRERLRIRARSVINATGVWAGTLDEQIRLRPSRGTHIVLDGADLGHPNAALTIPLPGSISRYVFALPRWDGRVHVGLTDEDAPGPIPDVARPTEGEITFLLDGYETKTVIQPMNAPWWDNLITEFFTENIVPFTLRDEREFKFDLQPAQPSGVNDLYDRAEQLRGEAQAPPRPKRRGFFAWLGFD